jgi:extradiol dioxygenase family protein
MKNILRPFHLAVPVHNLEECRTFYKKVLDMKEGRSSDHWVDFDFYGHQFVIHYSPEKTKLHYNPVDGDQVPVPHYGVVLDMSVWKELAERLKKENVEFVIAPTIRFKGQPGEQATLFFLDPAGNALEFKGFNDMKKLFAS